MSLTKEQIEEVLLFLEKTRPVGVEIETSLDNPKVKIKIPIKALDRRNIENSRQWFKKLQDIVYSYDPTWPWLLSLDPREQDFFAFEIYEKTRRKYTVTKYYKTESGYKKKEEKKPKINRFWEKYDLDKFFLEEKDV